MSQYLIPFSFQGAEVRTIIVNGEPAFVGKDICDRLGYVNSADAMNKHCKGVAKRYPLQTSGGVQEVRVLSEADVLRLIVRSKLPEAVEFERWVFEEVLPAIRKTGGYMAAAPEETPEELALRAMTILQATVERQKLQLAEVQPKADAHDRLAGADGTLSITEAAKALQLRPKDLFEWLSCNGWIYKRPGSANWLGYQAHTTNCDLAHKVTTVLRPDGSEKVSEQVRITPRGLTKLAKLMPGRMRAAA
ncbi:phage antirepressor KilAC domain-containing protein [Acetobacter orientalis]|uniref:phage antirepressor KilAC domain-containing protein n=1 Tax=Acetobacter orientalis TaxID=146474 RepID=UPI0039E9D660